MLASGGVLDKLHDNAYSLCMSSPAPAKPSKLTDRQALIFRLLTKEGLTARQVSDALRISTQGVYDAIAAIKAKGHEVSTDKGAANGAAKR